MKSAQPSCGTCARAHVAPRLGATPPHYLQCRANPPSADVGHLGTFPGVRPDDYCHSQYQAGEPRGAEGPADA